MENSRSGSRWREIEALADDLRRKIWENRDVLWQGEPPANQIQALEPGVALQYLGYEARSSDFLGVHNIDGKETEAAGEMDRERRIVEISRRFPNEVQLFTAAHEVGHILLHPDVPQLHRDVAVDGRSQSRDWREQEADRFAACFLMPRDLLTEQFVAIFGTEKFELNDDRAFALCGASLEKVLRTVRCERDLSRRLSVTPSYWGVPIRPLHQIFGVSATAMAIRLEELSLVGAIPAFRPPPSFLKARR